MPVYEVAGREGKPTRTSEELCKAIKENNKKFGKEQEVYYLQSFDEALKLIGDQVVVFMGAGDIDKEVRKHFKSKLLQV